jgi:hypothetical protein
MMKRVRRFLLICWLLGGLLAPLAVFAAEDDEEISDQAAAKNDISDGDDFQPQEDNFDRWIFRGQRDASTARAQMRWQLGQKLDVCVTRYHVTTEQLDKLSLAGSLDMKRFFEQADAIHRHFLAIHDHDGFQAVMQEVLPLQQKLQAGIFGEDSFFAKALRKMLKDGDDAAARGNVSEQALRHYRVGVEIHLIPIGDDLGLSDKQRAELVQLVLAETRPPRFSGTYEAWQIYGQIATIPNDKLMPLLDKRQVQQFVLRLEEYREPEKLMLETDARDRRLMQFRGANDDVDALIEEARP